MTRRLTGYDAIVIGAGHNGLVCAGYLARGGLRALVVESREAVGGMAETREVWPGVGVPVLAHTVGRLSPQIVRDLRLRAHGLRMVQPDVRVFAPQPDGRGIVLRGDVTLTANSLATNDLVGPRDAAVYGEIDAQLRALAGALAKINGRVPVDLASPRLGDIFAGVRTVFATRSRSQRAGRGLVTTMPMAVRDVVEEWFQSDALRAVIAARGVLLSGLGPRMPGSGAVLFNDSAGNDGGLAGQTVFARGGPGALSEGLASAARELGVEVRTRARVARVRRSGESAVGVALEGGEEIDASIVVSSLDPRTTLLSLLDPELVGPRLSWRATNIRQRGMTAKVNFALRGLPHFPAATDDPRTLRGRIVLGPSMKALDEAARPAKYGDVADEPLIEATIPTLVDPALIDSGRAAGVTHVLSATVQWVPYGATADIAQIATRTIESYSPGFAALIEERQVLAPKDIEREYGADGGHPMHAEVGLDQWFEWRPLHGFGRYRMPLRGMYLAGSGAHPGGGITGAPGQLAAREVLADVRAGLITLKS